MRKPRDYDAEMKALADKARLLKTRKQSQLGELVIACGADVLGIEELAGALLAAVAMTDGSTKEGWRKDGAAFFSGQQPNTRPSAGTNPNRIAANHGSTPSASTEPGAA